MGRYVLVFFEEKRKGAAAFATWIPEGRMERPLTVEEESALASGTLGRRPTFAEGWYLSVYPGILLTHPVTHWADVRVVSGRW